MSRIIEISKLKKECSNPEITPEKVIELKNKLINHEGALEIPRIRRYLFEILVKNPNIPFKEWEEFIDLNNDLKFAELALTNPSVELWLLEDTNQWENISQSVAKLLMQSHLASDLIIDLCKKAIENANKTIKAVGSFSKFIFPVTRRVFPNLMAHQLVSVQPINSPSAPFFLNFSKNNK